jgi:hypothetical protein
MNWWSDIDHSTNTMYEGGREKVRGDANERPVKHQSEARL